MLFFAQMKYLHTYTYACTYIHYILYIFFHLRRNCFVFTQVNVDSGLKKEFHNSWQTHII